MVVCMVRAAGAEWRRTPRPRTASPASVTLLLTARTLALIAALA